MSRQPSTSRPRADLVDFERAARTFIEAMLPGLEWPPVDPDPRPPIRLLSAHEDDVMIPVARQWRAAKFDAGFGWLTGPVEYGGAALTEEHEARFAEIEAEYATPGEDAFWFAMESVAPILLTYGSRDLKADLLPRIFRGDCLVCQLYSEPGAGSDLASLTTKAVPTRTDSWSVTGQKVWSSGAHRASIGLLLCRTGAQADRHRGITAFVVDMDAPGVEVRPLREIDGSAGFNEVFLTDVIVPDHQRLGEVGGGWVVAMGVQANARRRLSSRRRGKGGGLTTVASPERLAAILRRLGRSEERPLRQTWARVHTACFVVDRLTERMSDPKATGGPVDAAAGALAKLALTSALSQSSVALYETLGARITADTGTEDSFEWLPYVLQVPGYHIGGGTSEILKNVVAERGLGLPR